MDDALSDQQSVIQDAKRASMSGDAVYAVKTTEINGWEMMRSKPSTFLVCFTFVRGVVTDHEVAPTEIGRSY